MELLSSPHRTIPMTWGLWRTCLLLPEDAETWTPAALRSVLLHELAHARRCDCLTQLGTQIICALYWFNPLVWLASRQMQTERERACDDLVLRSATRASDYAEQLLHIAAERTVVRWGTAAIAMARPGTLERRLLAILDGKRNRRAITWTGLCLALVLLGTAVMSVAMLRADGQNLKGFDRNDPSGAIDKDAAQPAAPELPPQGFGRVVDVQGRPIAHAKLRNTKSTWTSESGPDGLFRLPDLPLATTGTTDRQEIAAPGFAKIKDLWFARNEEGKVFPNNGIIQLHRVGRLQGRVLGPNGKPLPGAPLSVHLYEQYPTHGGITTNALQGITDQEGRFTIENVPPGELLLSYPGEPGKFRTPPPPIKGIRTARILPLADGQRLTDVVLDLSKAVAVAEGRVIDSEGRPLPKAQVFLCWKTPRGWTDLPRMINSVKTDAQGRYRLDKLPMGSWHLQANLVDVSTPPMPVELSGTPAKVPDLVVSVIQTAGGRIRRQALDPELTVREWIDATRAKDIEGVAVVVMAGSPIARNGGRIMSLLPRIERFPSKDESTEGRANVTTNEVDLGNGRRAHVRFHLIKQGSQWRLTDVFDESGRSLVDVAGK